MNPRSRQAGLSLVELMISITLGLMVLAGVVTIFANSSAARSEVDRTSRQIENGRYASEILTDDLRLAGFYGERDVGSIAAPGALPGDPCSLAATDWNAWMPIHLQGFDDGAGFASANCSLTTHKAGTDVLVVRRARTCVAGTAGCDTAVAGSPYVQVALCQTQTTAHVLGLQGTATFDRLLKDCTTNAGLREYYVRIYFVSTDNGAGDNVPTLKRLELIGNSWTTTPLVEGIEEFQLEYGLDTDGDGSPDEYVADPTDYPAGACAGACQVTNWMNVMTVRFHLLARNIEASPNYSDTKTYVLGADAAGNPIEVTPGGAYRRHVYSGFVRIANPAARRDVP